MFVDMWGRAGGHTTRVDLSLTINTIGLSSSLTVNPFFFIINIPPFNFFCNIYIYTYICFFNRGPDFWMIVFIYLFILSTPAHFRKSFTANPIFARLKKINPRPSKKNNEQMYRDSVASAVESALMPWNGRHDVLIDRFDARAVLDMVPLSPKVGSQLINLFN